ncbi:MAG: chorismate-binding protein [Fimbriimonadaceae bacterium]
MAQTAITPVDKPKRRSAEAGGDAWFQEFLKSGAVLSQGNGRVWIGYGAVRRSARPSPDGLSTYAPDFLLKDETPWLVYDAGVEMAAGDLAQRLDAVSGGGNMDWRRPDHEAFAIAFEDVQLQISTGVLLKAVPIVARKSPTPLGAAHRAQALRRALAVASTYPMAAYGFWTDAGDGMIGATPELLFEQTPSGLFTMALAGTRPVHSERGSLLDDPKEMLEHRFVIEGIQARLAPLGPVTTGSTSEIRLPTLIHLHTPIRLTPSAAIDFQDAVAALHPTPAIGAWPLEHGWSWLRAQANATSRRRFGAPFGVLPPDGSSAKCVVAIRNVQWSSAGAVIHAGCGVVGPSLLDREWSELEAKLDAIQQALGL